MRYTTQAPMLVSRQFDDEIILANFETGLYYSLTNSAADIWLGLRSGATVEEIIAAFANLANGAENSRQVVTGFIAELLAEKIILPEAGTYNDAAWSPQFSDTFLQPVLERFDDLRDLLFLDPVHDVGDDGWPVQVKDSN